MLIEDRKCTDPHHKSKERNWNRGQKGHDKTSLREGPNPEIKSNVSIVEKK